MRQTTVSIQRPKGTTIATHIPIQIDQVAGVERFQYQQTFNITGADVWKIITLQWGVDTTHRLQRADRLIDEVYTDPQTNSAYIYYVPDRPRDHWGDHQECMAHSVVGG